MSIRRASQSARDRPKQFERRGVLTPEEFASGNLASVGNRHRNDHRRTRITEPRELVSKPTGRGLLSTATTLCCFARERQERRRDGAAVFLTFRGGESREIEPRNERERSLSRPRFLRGGQPAEAPDGETRPFSSADKCRHSRFVRPRGVSGTSFALTVGPFGQVVPTVADCTRPGGVVSFRRSTRSP